MRKKYHVVPTIFTKVSKHIEWIKDMTVIDGSDPGSRKRSQVATDDPIPGFSGIDLG